MDRREQGFVLVVVILLVALFGIGIIVYSTLQNTTNDRDLSEATPTAYAVVATPTSSQPKAPTVMPETRQDSVLYKSDRLGLTFSYSPTYAGDEAFVTEDGNKIYVGSKDYHSQYIEVFSKGNQGTVVEDIRERFLKNNSPEDCYVRELSDSERRYNDTRPEYKVLEIVSPQPYWSDEWFEDLSVCPSPYTTSNAVNFFAYDPKDPTWYIYYDVGQEPPWPSGVESPEGKYISWMDTVVMTDRLKERRSN